MKTVAINENEKNILELLQQAYYENIILQSPDGTEFILAEIDGFDREVELSRQNDELMAFLKNRAEQTEIIPLEDVKRRLNY